MQSRADLFILMSNDGTGRARSACFRCPLASLRANTAVIYEPGQAEAAAISECEQS